MSSILSPQSAQITRKSMKGQFIPPSSIIIASELEKIRSFSSEDGYHGSNTTTDPATDLEMSPPPQDKLNKIHQLPL